MKYTALRSFALTVYSIRATLLDNIVNMLNTCVQKVEKDQSWTNLIRPGLTV